MNEPKTQTKGETEEFRSLWVGRRNILYALVFCPFIRWSAYRRKREQFQRVYQSDGATQFAATDEIGRQTKYLRRDSELQAEEFIDEVREKEWKESI